MFKKKVKCRCGKKLDSSFAFCPYCGSQVREIKRQREEEDKEFKDFQNSFSNALGVPFIFRFPFKKLIREIDKQFQDMDKALGTNEIDKLSGAGVPIKKEGISISISSGTGREPVIRVKKLGQPEQQIRIKERREETPILEEKRELIKEKKLTKDQQKKLAKLPREEPQTSVRRLTDRVIYEIDMPGVENEKDIIINKLQNSIEIKAFTKDKAFFKLIPIDLPIKSHRLEDGKLILELKPEA